MGGNSELNKAGTQRVLAPKWDDRSTFTVGEAGEILGVSRCSAYSAANAGAIPVIRIGKRMIVPCIALERLLAGSSST